MKTAKLFSGAGMMLIVLALASTLPAQMQTLTVLHSFTNFPDGGRPAGRLLLDPAGNLYGTTTIGGAIGYGSVFKVDPSGNLSIFYSFAGPPDGNEPVSGLIRDAAGNLYGTTGHGGTTTVCGTDQPSWAGCGIVFKLDPSGTETVLHRFGSNGPDGAFPNGPLALDSSGTLWGSTQEGGHFGCKVPIPPNGRLVDVGCGTIFKVDASGRESVVHNFIKADGAGPIGGVVQDQAGSLYGVTVTGGLQNCPHAVFGSCGILVYDVSRWGRFQDTDEAAHYEFLCKSAGIPVHYCAETFVNDGSLPSSIMKALKRAMAGEYSRELGVKVRAGQTRLAELGFWQGGPPGIGYRRLLVSPDRKPKQLLVTGERKSIATDRVVLVPGPAEEIALVREIFRMFTEERMSMRAISIELNNRKVPSPMKANWTHSVVRTLVSHPKYVGCNVFNKTTSPLGSAEIRRPRKEWVICAGAHQGIVDPATFAKAQEILASLPNRKTNDQILDELRALLRAKGRLSAKVIDKAPGTPCARTVWSRFGGIPNAIQLIRAGALKGGTYE